LTYDQQADLIIAGNINSGWHKMYRKSITVLAGVMLTIALTGTLYPQSEGERVGQITQVNMKTGEIIVGSPSAAKDIKMGDLLYVRIEYKVVQLRATFPMQTVAKCKAEGNNRKLWTKAVKGMPVYRWKEGIADGRPAGDNKPVVDRVKERRMRSLAQ